MLALVTTVLLAATASPASTCVGTNCNSAATVGAAVTAASAVSTPVTCEMIESAGSISLFFTETNYDLDGGFSRMLKQVRGAMSSWYYTQPTDPMTIEELNELADGLQLSTMTAPNGEVFQAVNLGFGGGNSATYYFKNETTEMAPFIVMDGDCYDRGETMALLNDTLASRALLRAVRNDPRRIVSYPDARRIQNAVRTQLWEQMKSLPEMKRIVQEAVYSVGSDARARTVLETLAADLKDMVISDFTEEMPLPQSWTPEYQIESGMVKNDNGKIVLIGVSGVSAEDKDMIGRALPPVWGGVLRHRDTGPSPDREALGSQNGGNGILRIGTHTVPGDPVQYRIVDYVDVDDGSYTLYMAPSPHNPNKWVLTHTQFNN